MARFFRVFLSKRKLGWFDESEIDVYKRYGLLGKIESYVRSFPLRRRCYALYYKELFDKLSKTPFYSCLMKLGEIASKTNVRLYIVGGAIRDLILKDFIYREPDLLLEGELTSFLKVIEREGFLVKEETPFLTMKLQTNCYTFDVAICRKEFYEKPGVLPRVFPASLVEDLYRRDFTINAMALALSCEKEGLLYDPFYGLEDLEKGLLRVIRPYSFIEDSTRIIRGIRLKVRFSFDFDEETLELIKLAIREKALLSIGWMRFWRELEELFKEEKAIDAVLLMDDFGIWQSIGISLGESGKKILRKIAKENLSLEEKKEFLLYAIFGLQSEVNSEKWGLRFQLPKGIRESLSLASFWKSLEHMNFEEKYKLMKKAKESVVRFWSLCSGKDLIPLWKNFIETKPILSEEEIRRIAYDMGSEYGRIKVKVLRLQIEEGLKSKEDVLERLRKESA